MMSRQQDSTPPVYSVACISAVALGYEILLMRLFSIIQWHHFAYMIISLALLGYGISGALLTLFQSTLLRHFALSYIASIALFGVSAVGCYLLAQGLAFNTEEVLWDPRQSLWLLLNYLLLTLPFLFAANAIGLVLRRYRQEISRVYAADLLGAGLGSLGILGLLFTLLPMQALRAIGILGLFAAMLAVRELGRASEPVQTPVRVLLVFAALGLALLPSEWTRLEISPYKSLSQTLRIEDTRVMQTLSSPIALLNVVESPLIPFRHAPGLSLNARSEPPRQLGVFTDGDNLSVINRFNGDLSDLAFLDQLSSALPYHMRPLRRVLVLGAGGGSDVLQALYHRPEDIDAVELNPQFAQLLTDTYADYAGRLYQHRRVRLHIAEARSFVEHSSSYYDLIQVSLLDANAASSAGLFALSENYLYTVEGIGHMLDTLQSDGYLSLTRWIRLPPRDSLKLFATALAALERRGVRRPAQQLVLIRSWQTSTLLIKNGRLSTREIGAVKQFSRDWLFDTVYYPGVQRSETNRFNQLRDNWFYTGTQALLSERAGTFLDRYKFNLQVPTDDRPYFHHFFKWRALPELFQLRGRGGIPLADTGYLVLLATLLQAVLASLIFIFAPLWLYQKRGQAQTRVLGRGRVVAYFFSLGLGFLFIEIAMIQKLQLFLHHPLYSIAVVLSSFLIFSGLGSACSSHLRPAATTRRNPVLVPVTGILILGILYLFLPGPLFHGLSHLPDLLRILLAILLIAPLAFCMGMPFPLGLGQLSNHEPGLIPWAWAINGCASVVSAVLATLLAIHLGFTSVIVLALALYLVSAGLFPVAPDSPARVTHGRLGGR